MDFRLSGVQQQLRDLAKELVAREIAPILALNDATRPLPKSELLRVYAVLAEAGLTAPRIPEEAGGSGMSMLDYGLMFEQLPASVAISLIGHEVTVARIYAQSSPEQRERFLPGLLDGTKIGCTGTTEPNAGSDPRGVETRVRRDGDHFVIDGAKMWITNIDVCDIANVTCREGTGDAGRASLRRVIVERDVSPFETRDIPCLGLRQGHLGEAIFNGTRVPVANALGESGDAAKVLTLTWNSNRPLIGLVAVGLAQQALDLAVAYAGVRRQWGKAIGGHQLVQKLLADIQTAVVSSRLMCYYALETIDRGERANGISAMAKRYATTSCEAAINMAMHVHGAIGASVEAGIEQLYRDVRMLPIPDGTNEILTLIQGRELSGIDAIRA